MFCNIQMAYTRRGYIFFLHSLRSCILFHRISHFQTMDFFLGINQTFVKWWHKRTKDVIENTTNSSIFFERLICSLRCLLASLSPFWELLDKDTGELLAYTIVTSLRRIWGLIDVQNNLGIPRVHSILITLQSSMAFTMIQFDN